MIDLCVQMLPFTVNFDVYVMRNAKIGTLGRLSCANLRFEFCGSSPHVGCPILGLHPRKCAKHGLRTNPWVSRMPNLWVAPTEVCKAWIKDQSLGFPYAQSLARTHGSVQSLD